jgi:hypothetical protein
MRQLLRQMARSIQCWAAGLFMGGLPAFFIHLSKENKHLKGRLFAPRRILGPAVLNS